MKKYDAIYMGYEKDEFGYITKFAIDNYIHRYWMGRLKSKLGWLAKIVHHIARYSEVLAYCITLVVSGTVEVEPRDEADGWAVYRLEYGGPSWTQNK